ncbi:MAG: guanylate kinase, partial [Pseudomonadota bacterium]
NQGGFLEWKEVHGNLYGTPAEPIERALEAGRSIILDIDVEGAKEVFKKMPDAVGIFISPPDLSVLEQRLRCRATDSEETIRKRMVNAVTEMKAAEVFHHVIVNDDLDAATAQLAGLIARTSDTRSCTTGR